MSSDSSVHIKPPKSGKDKQLVKHYVFNETGNIMMSTTDNKSLVIEDSVRKVFNEVSVFFAGMTKAITSTPDPEAKDGSNYSLYNYHALQKVIDGSGLFIHVTEEDMKYSSTSWGAEFSKELIEAVIGLASGEDELSFAAPMISSMGQEGIKFSGEHHRQHTKVANIIFVCEYLLGMPIISAIVAYFDAREMADHLKAGKCFQTTHEHMQWIIHKDTYMFVTPTFIQEYAGKLDSPESDPDYLRLIAYLKSSLTDEPAFESIKDSEGNLISDGDALTQGKTYTIFGNNFEHIAKKGGSVNWVGESSDDSITTGKWNNTEITFTPKEALSSKKALGLYAKGDDPSKPSLTLYSLTVAEKSKGQ